MRFLADNTAAKVQHFFHMRKLFEKKCYFSAIINDFNGCYSMLGQAKIEAIFLSKQTKKREIA